MGVILGASVTPGKRRGVVPPPPLRPPPSGCIPFALWNFTEMQEVEGIRGLNDFESLYRPRRHTAMSAQRRFLPVTILALLMAGLVLLPSLTAAQASVTASTVRTAKG